MNKEIEIPEGYEAKIEDNKVIFVQKESEDERTRKGNIRFLESKEVEGLITYEARQLWIAYLEKQKEQKPHLELKAGKWYICHRAFCARADHLTVKEGERFQCEKDGIVKGFVIKEPEKYFKECGAPAPMEDEQQEQKSAEWSEEDEGELQNAIDALEFLGKKGVYKSESGYNAALQAASWLKNLPERFILQPKQEWDEEDEEKINNISEIIEHCTAIPYSGGTLTLSKEYKKELQHFIESLRPVSKESLQPHWKPSEEQMEALNKAIPVCMGVAGRDEIIPLESLYEQLKKL